MNTFTRKAPWTEGERELAQVHAFNKKLAWLPRFKIRNRVLPRMIQTRCAPQTRREQAAQTWPHRTKKGD